MKDPLENDQRFFLDQPQRRINDRMPDGGVFGGFTGFLLVVVEVHLDSLIF